MDSPERKWWHVVDFKDDFVYAANVPTLEQAEQILDEGYGGLMIVEDDQLTPNMHKEINEAIEKGLI